MLRPSPRALILLLFGACASPAEEGRPAPPAGRPPNIVVFLVDDLGWQDASLAFHTERTPFNERYRTPHLERLAARGMKFTQAYVSSICSPTRVSLMTGVNAARHRVTNWTLRLDESTDREHPRLELPEWNVNGLSPAAGVPRTYHARALPERLRSLGYRTIHVGKAHFGASGTPGADPRNLGFDVNVAGHAAGAPASYLGVQRFAAAGRNPERTGASVWDVPGLEEYHGKDVFLTEALTLEANREVRRAVADGEPFFLYLAHYAVHTPIMADAGFVENYTELPPTEAAYASMVEGVDASLGSVMATLEELGVADDTLILHLSDNGGITHAARAGEPFTHNAPLSSGKGSAHEGGTRVPLVVAGPGVAKSGTTCTTPVIVEDVLPTLLELAGSEVTDSGIDGVSFAPLLRGDELVGTPERAFVWHQPNYWITATGPGLGPHSALRLGDWKLVYYHDPARAERLELFHLGRDLSETTNLAASEPERLQTLARRLAVELERYDAQLPASKETGEPIPLPDQVASRL